MVKCYICQRNLPSVRSLSAHIRNTHKIDSETYWNMNNVRPVCPCGELTKFKNITLGYESFCGHSCAAKEWRSAMKNDASKFDAFREKVSNNMMKVWSERSDETRREIFAKAGASNSKRLSRMTDFERREKCNHNPDGFYESIKGFWGSASDEEKTRVYALITRNASSTMASRTPEEYVVRRHAMVDAWEAAGGFAAIDKSLGV